METSKDFQRMAVVKQKAVVQRRANRARPRNLSKQILIIIALRLSAMLEVSRDYLKQTVRGLTSQDSYATEAERAVSCVAVFE